MEGLTDKQIATIEALVEGMTQRDAAKSAGVNESTVSTWRNSDAAFVAELNTRRADVWAGKVRKLRDLGNEALVVLADVLQSDDDRLRLRASLAVLDRVGLSEVGAPAIGAATVKRAEREFADREKLEELLAVW